MIGVRRRRGLLIVVGLVAVWHDRHDFPWLADR